MYIAGARDLRGRNRRLAWQVAELLIQLNGLRGSDPLYTRGANCYAIAFAVARFFPELRLVEGEVPTGEHSDGSIEWTCHVWLELSGRWVFDVKPPADDLYFGLMVFDMRNPFHRTRYCKLSSHDLAVRMNRKRPGLRTAKRCLIRSIARLLRRRDPVRVVRARHY
jgi:hypothetical protein